MPTLGILQEGDTVGVAETFGRAWLNAYGMDDVDATITDVVGHSAQVSNE